MPNKLDTPDSPASANRFERRRARTRQALIAAARQILAETGETSASIQEIADRADVGFGTFYNHFETKNDLFDAAVGDTLEEYGQLLDSVTEGIDDPAAVFAASVRLTLRLAASHPEITQILRLRGLPHINAPTGLGPRALRDLEVGKASGRFTFEDPLVALSAVGGALIGLLQLNAARDLDAAAGEQMAEMILRMLGLPAGEAHEISTRPLPELP
ncbi:TetR family transcriptional regulator [Streptomyces cellostaticus]|uniref:TetR family transcriptional regulator n=1 Tax=Streptomyces cellostaticus TaxID=67285 RepID=A0A101N0M6_9ACTN|nr:TetR/AcrR family transcriptional regulator [Streptomyces cellostaticus]KUM84313.1 TetR family transcriptional regulator [Streptomyces cellostaticus]GHI01776.1 putative TetR-family transcriptional regulator [Streptomyces cellostaticus]